MQPSLLSIGNSCTLCGKTINFNHKLWLWSSPERETAKLSFQSAVQTEFHCEEIKRPHTTSDGLSQTYFTGDYDVLMFHCLRQVS